VNRNAIGTGGVLVLVLIGLHLALGLARLPAKVWARRLDDIARYRELGPARFLLDEAGLEGAPVIEWLLANVPEDEAVLWRWPADGALEFVAALIAPRLLVDERAIAATAEQHGGRRLARGVIPSGERGRIVVQGTPGGGLRLLVRED
jgi:hypothetical protein